MFFPLKPMSAILGVAVAGGFLLIVRDLLAMIFCVLVDNPLDFGARFLSFTIPGALIAALFTFALYFLAERLYKKRFMWPTPLHLKMDGRM